MLRATSGVVLGIALASFACLSDDRDRFDGASRPIVRARITVGDDVRFAASSFDDAHWPERSLYALPEPPATFWIRTGVVLTEERDGRPLGLYVSLLAATEVFWDGVPVGKSGAIGGDGGFVAAGPLDSLFILGAEASRPGPHLLAIRAASPHEASRVRTTFYGLALGDYEAMTRNRIRSLLLPFAGLGVFLVIGGYYLTLWIASRQRTSYLVFAFLCFGASLLVVAESYRPLVGYAFDRHLARLEVVYGLSVAVAVLLPLFFLIDLGFPRRWIVVVVAALISTCAIDSFDSRALATFAISVSGAAAIVTAGFVRGRRDYAALVGIAILAVALVVGGYWFLDRTFFLAFSAFIACVLVSMTLEQRRHRQEHERATLRAARLEIELLRRTIQPHFLMNTLTAVMEWIEEEPHQGLRFLQALADELRILNEVSGEVLILVGREVDLCDQHLTLMSCRTGMHFTLVTERLDRTATVPPAIFHTLIENAITHNRYRAERIVFRLAEERDGAARKYVLDTPLARDSGPATRDGVGLRYVKTRLEESYPGRWQLQCQPVEDVWRTTIELLP